MTLLVHGSRIVSMRSGTNAVSEDRSRPPTMTRRAFLRGRFSAKAEEPRPPWALASPAFEQACTRCDACIAACPSRIVVRGEAGYPRIDFRQGTGECTFCGECAAACQPGALKHAANAAPWRLKASVGGGLPGLQGHRLPFLRRYLQRRRHPFPPAAGRRGAAGTRSSGMHRLRRMYRRMSERGHRH